MSHLCLRLLSYCLSSFTKQTESFFQTFGSEMDKLDSIATILMSHHIIFLLLTDTLDI